MPRTTSISWQGFCLPPFLAHIPQIYPHINPHMWGKTTPHIPVYRVIKGTNTRRHMSATHPSSKYDDEPRTYEIRIKGHLDDKWVDWFDGLSIAREDNGETLLRGPVIDQAALHGLLRKVRDLGMPLLSVTHVGPSQADA